MTIKTASLPLRAAIAVVAASTVLPLLGACYGIAPMQRLAVLILPVSVSLVALAMAWAHRKGDTLTVGRLSRGIWGGMAGVGGYDWIRVPFHSFGMNPFAAIRSYGMWLTGAGHCSFGTDVIGLLYHLLNGVGFGIAYALVAPLGRKAALAGAVVWGVGLEAIAVGSAFGTVYQLQGWSPAVICAFFAHLFYGWPLGKVVIADSLSKGLKTGILLAVLSAMGWLLWVFYSSSGYALMPMGRVEVTKRQIQPAWTRIELGQTLTLYNLSDEPRTLRLPADPRQKATVAPGGSVPLSFDQPGIYQVLIERKGLRSAFVIVEKGGLIRTP